MLQYDLTLVLLLVQSISFLNSTTDFLISELCRCCRGSCIGLHLHSVAFVVLVGSLLPQQGHIF